MATFIITEKQTVNSSREGRAVQAADLTAAKRAASSMQMFQGTVMTVSDEAGNILASKQDGAWSNAASC